MRRPGSRDRGSRGRGAGAASPAAAGTGALLAGLLLAGCGGHAATHAGVVARGDAICASANAAIRAVPSTGSGSDVQLGRYFSRVAPILRREAASLDDLPRPVAERATLTALLAAERRTAVDYGRLAVAARAGDQPAVQAALGRLASSPVARLATRYGLTQCTGAAATIR